MTKDCSKCSWVTPGLEKYPTRQCSLQDCWEQRFGKTGLGRKDPWELLAEETLIAEARDLVAKYHPCYSTEEEGPCPCEPCRTARALKGLLTLITGEEPRVQDE